MLHRRKEKGANSTASPTQNGGGDASQQPGTPQAPRSGQESDRRARLGEMLIEEGFITPAQLEEALEKKKQSGGFLGQVLVELAYLDRANLIAFLVKQCRIPHISLLDYEVSDSLFEFIPQAVCLEFHLLPIDKLGKILTVAMVDPLDVEALEQIRAKCPDLKIKPILCDWDHFETVSRRLFGQKPVESQEVTASSFGLSEKTPADAKKPPDPAQEAAVDAAVKNLVKGAAAEPRTDGRRPESGEGRGPSPSAKTKSMAGPGEQVSRPKNGGPAPEDLAAAITGGIRQAMKESLEPLIRAQQAAAAQAVEAAQAAARSTENAPPPDGREQEETAEPDNLAPFPGTTPLGGKATATKPELDALEAIDGPGGRTRSDDRVRAVLDAQTPLEGYAFEEFFAGKANTFAVKVAQAIAENPGGEFTPLYLYGDVGLGKTHLVCAIGNAIHEQHPDLRTGYVSSSRLTRHLAEAADHRAMQAFRDHYTHWDTLILDDIQFLGGHPRRTGGIAPHSGRVASRKAPDYYRGQQSPGPIGGVREGAHLPLFGRYRNGIGAPGAGGPDADSRPLCGPHQGACFKGSARIDRQAHPPRRPEDVGLFTEGHCIRRRSRPRYHL